MELKQYLKLTQQLVMTPQLQQAIKLLQLSRIEIDDLISEQLHENPLLEDQRENAQLTSRAETSTEARERRIAELQQERSDDGDKTLPAGDSESPVPRDSNELNWETFAENYQYFSYTSSPGTRLSQDDPPPLENTVACQSSLHDHLQWQLGVSDISPRDAEIASFIIGNLDDDGYLKNLSLEDLAAHTGASVEEAEEVLLRVQELDPPGVAARDLSECLIIQAQTHYPQNGTLLRLVRDHLPDLERRNVTPILRALDIDAEQLKEALSLLSAMEPKPGRAFQTNETEYITPDVYVHNIGGEYVTVLNEDGMPKLKVSTYYRNLLNSNPSGTDREYIQDKFRSAVWLIRSIHQRQNTIRKVTESIVRFQKDFLDRGIKYMRPLILRDVAEDIGMHESTVSRVTTNKYVHTPQGIFELKYFFNSRITGTAGRDLSSESVKTRIKQLIETEDHRRPYSDQKIVALLGAEGIDIARRTVAKYREMLGILSSSKRKQLL